jgi:hypothetical protein
MNAVEKTSDLALRIANLADQNGIYPRHVATDAELLAKLGVDPSELTADIMASADRLFYRAIHETMDRINRYNARCTPTILPLAEEHFVQPAEESTPKPPRKVTRAQIFGYPVTAVLRWMGKTGWDFEAAITAVTTITNAYSLSPSTVRIQLRAGKKGERGEPADITPSQAKKLRLAAC